MLTLISLFVIILFLSVPGEGFLFQEVSYPKCPSLHTYTSQRVPTHTKCYEFILNERKDWVHAQLDCRKKGGRLVTIETTDEELFLERLLKNYNYHQKGVWIGLNDIYQEGHFVWDSGKSVTFTRWGSGQPDDFRYNQHQDCVLLCVPHHYEMHNGVQYAVYNGTSGWHDEACQDGYGAREDEGWICEYEGLQQLTTASPPHHVTIIPGQTINPMTTYSCPSQFTYSGHRTIIGNKCYEFILFHPVDWVHAREDCHKKGGYLVTIENIQEEKLLTRYIQSTQYKGKGVWIGLNDLQQEGQFVWDSGRAVDFKHWESGQPDDNQYQQQQDCVLLYPPHPDSNDSPGWHDQMCQDSDIPVHIPFLYEDNGWICEYYIPSYPHTTSSTTKRVTTKPTFKTTTVPTTTKTPSTSSSTTTTKTVPTTTAPPTTPNTPTTTTTTTTIATQTTSTSNKTTTPKTLATTTDTPTTTTTRTTTTKQPTTAPTATKILTTIPATKTFTSGKTSTTATTTKTFASKFSPGSQQVLTPQSSTVNPKSSCPSQTSYPGNRTIIGAKCYEYILSHSANWVLAREDCHKKGGYLVTIENIQEEKLLTHYIQSTQYRGKGVWIGLNDLQQEGQFVWDSGEMAGFRHWLPGHPDNNTILQQLQDCILLYLPYDETTLTSPGWGDQICTYDNGWVCEYHLDPPTTFSTKQQSTQ